MVSPVDRPGIEKFFEDAKAASQQGLYGDGFQICETDFQLYYDQFLVIRFKKGGEKADKEGAVALLFANLDRNRFIPCNSFVGRLLEDIVPAAPVSLVLRFCENVTDEDLKTYMLDTYAFRFVQKLLYRCYRPFKDGAIIKTFPDIEQLPDREESDEPQAAAESFIGKVTNIIAKSASTYIPDPSAAFVIRSLVEVSSCVIIKPPHDANPLPVPTERVQLSPKLRDVFTTLVQGLIDIPDLTEMIDAEHGAGIYQYVILILGWTDPEACSIFIDALVASYPVPEILPEEMSPVLKRRRLARTLELIIANGHADQHRTIRERYFTAGIRHMNNHYLGSRMLCRLLEYWTDAESFVPLSDTVLEGIATFPPELNKGHHQILLDYVACCRRFNVHQPECLDALLKCLDCHEPEDRLTHSAVCIMFLANHSRYNQIISKRHDWKVSEVGAKILIHILNFDDPPMMLMAGLLTIPMDNIKMYATMHESYQVYDQFSRSRSMGEDHRAAFFDVIKDLVWHLGGYKHGCTILRHHWDASPVDRRVVIAQSLLTESDLLKNGTASDASAAKNRHSDRLCEHCQLDMFKTDFAGWTMLMEQDYQNFLANGIVYEEVDEKPKVAYPDQKPSIPRTKNRSHASKFSQNRKRKNRSQSNDRHFQNGRGNHRGRWIDPHYRDPNREPSKREQSRPSRRFRK